MGRDEWQRAVRAMRSIPGRVDEVLRQIGELRKLHRALDDVIRLLIQQGDLLEQDARNLAQITRTLRYYTDEQPISRIRLEIPWLSQMGPGAGYAPGDCGAATLAMWLRHLGHDVAVDDVSRATGRPPGFRFLRVGDLIRAARQWGMELYWRRGLGMDDLIEELEAGRPAIALIHYPSLPQNHRYDPRYPYGHFILIAGCDRDSIIYHDPYWPPDSGRGAYEEIPRADFERAWARSYLNGNSPNQALRMRA